VIVHILDSARVASPSVAYDAELCLPEDYGSPALARQFAHETLSRWDYRGRHDDVVLVVSELVANALVHGHGSPVLRLRATAEPDGQAPAGVRVEVADDSRVLPEPRGPGAGGGWGLKLVERLAAGWGAVHRGRGKVVWCELVPRLDHDRVLPEATAA
jgi:hypothetical protein